MYIYIYTYVYQHSGPKPGSSGMWCSRMWCLIIIVKRANDKNDSKLC